MLMPQTRMEKSKFMADRGRPGRPPQQTKPPEDNCNYNNCGNLVRARHNAATMIPAHRQCNTGAGREKSGKLFGIVWLSTFKYPKQKILLIIFGQV